MNFQTSPFKQSIIHRITIGLQFDVRCLSPLLYKGSTDEIFHPSWKIPNERDTLIIWLGVYIQFERYA